MDQLQTLPLLLDLSTPSYPNARPDSQVKRPQTASINKKTISSTSPYNLQKHSKKKSQITPKNYNYSKTIQTFHNESYETDKDSFCFSELRTMPRPLPKLYTVTQYENFSRKLENLKDKYTRLYGKTEVTEGDFTQELNPENIKDLVLDAEKMFNASYSIKYFGLKDNQLGIISKRIPMQKPKEVSGQLPRQSVRSPHVPIKRPDTYQYRRERDENSVKARTYSAMNNREMSKTSISGWGSPDIRDNVTPTEADTRRNGTGKINKTEESATEKSPISDKRKYPPEAYELVKTTSFDMSIINTDQKGKGRQSPSDSPNKVQTKSPIRDSSREEINQLNTSKDQSNIEKKTKRENTTTEYAQDIDDVVGIVGMTGLNETQDRDFMTTGCFEDLKGTINYTTESNPHIVTQYFIPKKLHAVKKRNQENIRKGHNFENQTWDPQQTTQTNFWRNRTVKPKGSSQVSWTANELEDQSRVWVKVAVNDQRISNTADFERKVKSLGKVKRNILRNVRVEQAWEEKGVKDELDVLEQYRTHEMRKIMADKAKYSYAKLLQTMQTNERPETALVENTEKMEKLEKRKERCWG